MAADIELYRSLYEDSPTLQSRFPTVEDYLASKGVQTQPPAEGPGILERAGTGAKALGLGLWDAAMNQLPATVARTYRAGDVGDPRVNGSRLVDNFIKGQDQDSKDVQGKLTPQEQATEVIPGFTVPFTDFKVPAITGKDIASGVGNLGYSAPSMAAGLAAGAVAAPTGPGAAGAAAATAGAVGGVVGYRATKDQFVQEATDHYLQKNPQASEQDVRQFQKNLDPLATEYGLWEAGPEAVSQAVTAGLIKLPVADMLSKVFPAFKAAGPAMKANLMGKIASGAIKTGTDLGEELTTETITQKNQGRIEAEVGMRDKAPTWGESFQEVYPQVVPMTGVTMGAGGLHEMALERARAKRAADAKPSTTPATDAIINELSGQPVAPAQPQVSQEQADIDALNKSYQDRIEAVRPPVNALADVQAGDPAARVGGAMDTTDWLANLDQARGQRGMDTARQADPLGALQQHDPAQSAALMSDTNDWLAALEGLAQSPADQPTPGPQVQDFTDPKLDAALAALAPQPGAFDPRVDLGSPEWATRRVELNREVPYQAPVEPSRTSYADPKLDAALAKLREGHLFTPADFEAMDRHDPNWRARMVQLGREVPHQAPVGPVAASYVDPKTDAALAAIRDTRDRETLAAAQQANPVADLTAQEPAQRAGVVEQPRVEAQPRMEAPAPVPGPVEQDYTDPATEQALAKIMLDQMKDQPAALPAGGQNFELAGALPKYTFDNLTGKRDQELWKIAAEVGVLRPKRLAGDALRRAIVKTQADAQNEIKTKTDAELAAHKSYFDDLRNAALSDPEMISDPVVRQVWGRLDASSLTPDQRRAITDTHGPGIFFSPTKLPADVVQRYRAGKLSPEEVKRYQRQYGPQAFSRLNRLGVAQDVLEEEIRSSGLLRDDFGGDNLVSYLADAKSAGQQKQAMLAAIDAHAADMQQQIIRTNLEGPNVRYDFRPQEAPQLGEALSRGAGLDRQADPAGGRVQEGQGGHRLSEDRRATEGPAGAAAADEINRHLERASDTAAAVDDWLASVFGTKEGEVMGEAPPSERRAPAAQGGDRLATLRDSLMREEQALQKGDYLEDPEASPEYQRTGGAGVKDALTAEQAQSMLAEAGLSQVAEVHENLASMPPHVQDAVRTSHGENEPAFYYGRKLYFNLENTDGVDGLARAIAHEIIHPAVESFGRRLAYDLGARQAQLKLNSVLDRIYSDHRGDIQKLLVDRGYAQDYDVRTATGRRGVAVEFLATQAETITPRWYDKAVGAFMDLLNAVRTALGLKPARMSKAEVRRLIGAMQEAYREEQAPQQGRPVTGTPQPSYQRDDNTEPVRYFRQEAELRDSPKLVSDAPTAIVKDDMRRFQRVFSLPHWLAKQFPALKALVERQYRRQEERLGLLHDAMQSAESFFTLDKKQTAEAERIIWEIEGKKIPELGAWNTLIGQFANGRDRMALNEEHYTALESYLQDKLGATPEIAKGITDLRRSLDQSYVDVYNRFAQIKDAKESDVAKMRSELGKIDNYFPHKRYGDFYIKAVDRATGETVYREHFNAMGGSSDAKSPLGRKRLASEAQKRIDAAKVQLDDPGVRWEYGTVENMPESVFESPIPMEAVQQILNSAVEHITDPKVREDARDALAQGFSDEMKARGHGSHFIKRRNVPGFEKTDLKKIAFDHFSGAYGFLTKMDAARDFTQLMRGFDAKTNPNLYSYAKRYMQDMLQNASGLDRAVATFKAIAFLKYLGFRLPTAIVNLTQNIITGAPTLAMHIGGMGGQYYWTALKNLTDLAKYAVTGRADRLKGLRPDEARFLHGAYAAGYTRAAFMDSVRMEVMDSAAQRFLGGVMRVAGWPMEVTERFNRASLALAAFRAARDGKIINEKTLAELGLEKGQRASVEQASKFAEQMTLDGHFAYDKGNMPEPLRGTDLGKVVSSAYQFRRFSHNMAGWYADAFRERGNGGLRALGLHLGGLITLGGLASLPLYGTVMAAIMHSSGEDGEEWLRKRLKMGDKWIYGLPSMLGVSFSGSMGMDLPVVSEMNDKHKGSPIWDLLGIPGAIFKEAGAAHAAYAAGLPGRALVASPLTPSVVRSIANAQRMAIEGVHSISGKPIPKPGEKQAMKLTEGQKWAKTLGFAPVEIDKAWKVSESVAAQKAFVDDVKSEFASRYVNAMRAGRTDAAREVLREVQEWNRAALREKKRYMVIDLHAAVRARMQPVTTSKQFQPRAREMMKDRSE